MNREDDELYYARRARQERERAERAVDCAVSSIHRTLAAEYERRIGRDQVQAQR